MSGDLDLDAVFGRSSPDDAFAAVLTEARMVLAEISSPLQAELWGSDILAALGGTRSAAAQAVVPAAERTGTPEAWPSSGCWPPSACLTCRSRRARRRPAGRPGGAGRRVGGRDRLARAR